MDCGGGRLFSGTHLRGRTSSISFSFRFARRRHPHSPNTSFLPPPFLSRRRRRGCRLPPRHKFFFFDLHLLAGR